MKDQSPFQATPLPSPADIKKKFPVSSNARRAISSARARTTSILQNIEKGLIIVTGPCSIHNESSAIEFGQRLLELEKRYPGLCFVMRAHFEKPRTATGWKGFAYDPMLDGSNQSEKGLHLSRSILVRLAEMGVAITSELLDPFLYPYFSDLYSMGNIGARTIHSSIHRGLASMSPFPIGLKNPLDGDIEGCLAAMESCETPQQFYGLSEEGAPISIASPGNASLFLILRGSKKGANCDTHTVEAIHKQCHKKGRFPSFMIDCGHDNSGKDVNRARQNLKDALELSQNKHLNIQGIIAESHLRSGRQTLSPSSVPYLSVTDPCLGIEELEEALSTHFKVAALHSPA